MKRLMACLMLLVTQLPSATAEPPAYEVTLTVTDEPRFPRTPMSPKIDFAALLDKAGDAGVLDLNSIELLNAATGEPVSFGLSEYFAYGDTGHIEWVLTNPKHREYTIRFRSCAERPAMAPRRYTPVVGVGDLLRYNAGEPRPVAMPYLGGLADITGDGRRDLVGCWNYAYRQGWPWDGVICYPRTGSADAFKVSDLVRLRHVAKDAWDRPEHFTTTYMTTAFADLNRDGLTDLVYSPRNGESLHLYINSGRKDAGGLPLFTLGQTLPRPSKTWDPCRAVDLDQDGAIDLFVGGVYKGGARGGFYLRNTNPDGYPMELAGAVGLDLEQCPCFMDLDDDGALDAIALEAVDGRGLSEFRVVWHRNLGGETPSFATPEPLAGVGPGFPQYLAAVREGPRRGLLVQHNYCQQIAFYEHLSASPPFFVRASRVESESAVMALSDQPWPWPCDWDGDGDLDLLVGGGYGWPRIVINEGTADRPAYAEAQHILANGEPIRLLRDEILGEPPHGHNMGYSYPAYLDWDVDGLPDLLLPNETNRILWYCNEGTRESPTFGEQRQILVDGYPDSPEARRQSAERALKDTYPKEKERPFFWRDGAAFADFNGDGLPDLATGDGFTRELTLFIRYRDKSGALRLRKQGPLTLDDGRVITWDIVGRNDTWTESRKAVDWNRDGLIDLVYSLAGRAPSEPSIYLLVNVGTREKPLFEQPRALCCYGDPLTISRHGPQAWAGDFDGDGYADILASVEWGVYPFYAHAAIEMPAHPAYTLGDPIHTPDQKR